MPGPGAEDLFPEMGSEPDYSGVLRRLDLALVLARNDVEVERGVARALWAGHLSTLGPGSRLMVIRSNPDLQTWGAFDLLLAEAKRITLDRPVDAVDLAYAALAVTDLLAPRAYGEERIHDFRAGAWAALAPAAGRAPRGLPRAGDDGAAAVVPERRVIDGNR